MFIDELPIGRGTLGFTLCPGILLEPDDPESPERRLQVDLEAIKAWGASALVSLLEDHEFDILHVTKLGEQAEAMGMDWYHLPIANHDTPDDWFEIHWSYAGCRLHALLHEGRKVAVHCRAGYERSGTVAARLLVEQGASPEAALQNIRAVQEISLEDEQRLAYIASCTPRTQDAVWENRVLGCLLGGAAGDGLGYALEFSPWSEIRRRYGPAGLQHPVLHNGQLIVSDDTQMTLFTLEGLLRGDMRNEDDVVAQIRLAYLDWLWTQNRDSEGEPKGTLCLYRELQQRRAPGHTCQAGLRAGGHGTPEQPSNNSKGCGGVMRSAPLGLVKAWDLEQVIRIAARTAAITHGHPDGIWSTGAMSGLVRILLDGCTLRAAAETVITALTPNPAAQGTVQAMRNALSAVDADRPDHPQAIRHLLGEGWTGEEALAIGLYAALQGNSLSQAVTLGANHDGDSDSTAALAGQLYGAWHGVAALPNEWVRRLDIINPACQVIFEFLQRHG